MAIPADVDISACNIYASQRKNGRWRLVLSYKADGKWRQANKSLPEDVDTENKAKRRISEWRKELIEEQEEAKKAALAEAESREREESPNVYDYCDWYVNTLLKGSKSVKPRSIGSYNGSLRYILDGFSLTRMSNLTQDAVQAWVNEMNTHLAPVTVRKALQLLKRVCEYAVKHDVIAKNPCDDVVQPRLVTKEKNSMSVEGYQKVAAFLRDSEPTPLKAGASIALYTGMREGEVCGLRWQDVSLERSELHVRHAIVEVEHGTELGETKRAASTRAVSFGEVLKAVLTERHDQIMQRAVENGFSTEQFGRLYVLGDVDGAYFAPERLGKEWGQLARAMGWHGLAGRYVTFHDLRHTYATVAIASGADVMAVASSLGHSDPHITLKTYANADPAAKKRTADIMDKVARA